MTIEQVQSQIDKANETFAICRGTLRSIRNNTPGSLDFLGFQPQLARILYSLEEILLRIKQQMKNLVPPKAPPPDNLAQKTLTELAFMVKAIEGTIDRGKVLGDSFAWLFYNKEDELLKKHYSHEVVRHMPTGIGGLGEVKFIANSPSLGHYILIYHGITTFLRVGDVSYFDAKTGRIAGLAELKTAKAGKGMMNIRVHYIGKKLDLTFIPKQSVSPPLPPPDVTVNQDSFESALRRQYIKMRDATSAPPAPNVIGGDISAIFNPGLLDELYQKTTDTTAGHILFSPGICLTGFKVNFPGLSEQMLNDGDCNIEALAPALASEVVKIVKHGSKNNSIKVSGLLYSKDRYSCKFGDKPIAWWPLADQVVDDILSGRFHITICFNPAHILDKLEQTGFIVVRSKEGRPNGLLCQLNGESVHFQGLEHFLEFASGKLINEDSVCSMIIGTVKAVEGKVPAHRRITLDVKIKYMN